MPASLQGTERVPTIGQGQGRQHSLTASIADGYKVVAERFRTKMCRNFAEKGSCPYEARCMFAHGRHQLRTKQKNLSDGLVSEEAIRQFKRGLMAQKSRRVAGAHTLPTLSVPNAVCKPYSADCSTPSPPSSTPPSEHAEGQVGTGECGSELNFSVVPDLDESELRTSPELTLHSLRWYRRNPYDWNNTIVLSPSAASSRGSAIGDPAE